MATHNVNNIKIQLRRDTAAGWTTANPVLLNGEVGIETDTLKAKVGDGTTTWNSLGYAFWHDYTHDDLVPFTTKTYTDLYANPNNFAGGTFYYAKIVPDDFYKPWRAKFRLHVYVPNQVNYDGVYTVDVGGCQSEYRVFSVENNFYSTSYRPIYYHVLYRATQTGAATYGHLFGTQIYAATNGNSTSYKRTIEVELLSQENCTVTLFDTAVTYANAPGTGSTNYAGYTQYNGVDYGYKVYGDVNTYYLTQLSSYNAIAGAAGIKQYALIMQDADGNWQGFCNEAGTGNTKTKNTAGFRLGRVYYNYSSTNYAENERASAIYEHCTKDLRYDCNCGTTTLTAYLPVYLKGSLGSDGLFYLADDWITQTLPTTDDGYLYIELGRMYSTYQVSLGITKPIWWFKDGALREYAYSSTATIVGSYLPSSGGTVTGSITLSGSVQGFYDKYTGITRGTNPSPNALVPEPFIMYDADNKPLLRIQKGIGTDGSTYAALTDFKHDSSANNYYSDLKVGYDATNNYYYAACPTPPNASDTNHIATTSWVKTKIGSSVVTSSNNGKLSVNGSDVAVYSLPKASSSALGGIKVGTNLSIDSNGVLSATDTTYSAEDGIAISNAKAISNTGVRSIATGSSNGTISVNTNGTSANVSVKGLGDRAFDSTAYLPLAGGTATGNITVNKVSPVFAARHSNITRSSTPSSNISWMPFVIEDKDGANVGGIYNILYSSGVTGTALIDYNHNGDYHYMGMFHDASGNPYGYCPTPPAASDSTTIATTEWVRDYATPANIGASTTDENVKSTATSPSSATDYYPIASSSSSTNTSTTIKNAAFNVNLQNGTASAEGYAKLRLGNTTATGTAGNMTGRLTLYNDKGKSTTLDSHVGDTTNRNTYLPKASGTLVCHTTDTAIGSTSKPVYVNENGFVAECGSSLTDYLPLAGGELSGNAVRVSAGITPGFVVKSTNLTKGTAPGSAAGAYSFFWRDGADANIGGLYRQISTANLSELRIYNNWTASEYVSLGMTSASACDFSPGTDNAVTLGKSGKRWKQLIAGTTTISTSDERLKRSIKAIPDKVLDAWGDVQWVQFQFKDSYKEKGKQARLHTGAIAQRIKAVFEEHGIDPFKYGLLCYDSWDADDDFKAGDCYSLRYEEALCMEAAYQRRRADRLESRIEALEKAVKG